MLLFSNGKLLLHAPVTDVIETLRERIPPDEIRLNPADEILRTLIDPIKGNPIIRAIVKRQESSLNSVIRPHTDELIAINDDTSIIQTEVTETDHATTPMNQHQTRDFSTAPFWTQFAACLDRSFKQFYRQWFTLVTDSLVCIGIGLLIGAIFQNIEFRGSLPEEIYKQCPLILRSYAMFPLSDKIAAFSTFLELALAMIAIMRALRVFGHEMENFKRESFAGLNTWMYFLARDLVCLVPILLISLFFTAGIFIANPEANFGIYLVIALLAIVTSFPIGYTISFFFNPQQAQLAATLVVLVFFAISGNTPTLPEIEQLPFPLSYSHVFSYLRYVKGLFYMVEIETRRESENIGTALRMNGYELESMSYYWYAIIFWAVLLRIFSVFCLWQLKPHSLFNRFIILVKTLCGKIYEKVLAATAEMREDLNHVEARRR